MEHRLRVRECLQHSESLGKMRRSFEIPNKHIFDDLLGDVQTLDRISSLQPVVALMHSSISIS